METTPSLTAASPFFFDAVLTPNRSLPRAGFYAVMAGVGAVSLGLGLYFVLNGAWPIFGFFGLDVGLLYLAFRISYRSGRLIEIVRLSASELLVRRTTQRGHSAEWRFNPFWVRVEIDAEAEHGSPLVLASHGERIEIAAFLSPEERVEFANALKGALAEAARAAPPP